MFNNIPMKISAKRIRICYKYRFSANKKMKNNEHVKMKNNETHGNKWRKDLSFCLTAVWILAEELERLTVFSGMCHCWNDVFNHTCEEEDKRKKDVNTYQGQNTEEMLSIRAVLIDSMYDLSGLAIQKNIMDQRLQPHFHEKNCQNVMQHWNIISKTRR